MIVTERAAALLVYGFFFLDDCDVDAGATIHTEVDTKKREREVGGTKREEGGMKAHKVKLTEILLQGKGVLFSTWQ